VQIVTHTDNASTTLKGYVNYSAYGREVTPTQNECVNCSAYGREVTPTQDECVNCSAYGREVTPTQNECVNCSACRWGVYVDNDYAFWSCCVQDEVFEVADTLKLVRKVCTFGHIYA
jgi:hypothetical protein